MKCPKCKTEMKEMINWGNWKIKIWLCVNVNCELDRVEIEGMKMLMVRKNR